MSYLPIAHQMRQHRGMTRANYPARREADQVSIEGDVVNFRVPLGTTGWPDFSSLVRIRAASNSSGSGSRSR
jgi:hypothetical protein